MSGLFILVDAGRHVADGWEKQTLVDVHAVCAVEVIAILALLRITLQSQENSANTG